MKKELNAKQLRDYYQSVNKFDKFLEERDRTILSLDKEKILFYMRKYNIPRTDNGDDKLFWAGVHYAITQMNKATNEQKETSISWLAANGFELPDKVDFDEEDADEEDDN